MKCGPKQLRFIEEYLVDLNGEAAAGRAGYNRQYGRELLRKPTVKAEIAKRQEAAAENTGLTPERVLEELAAIAFADIRDAFNAEGNLKPVKDLPGHLVASIEVRGKGTSTITKLRLWPKTQSLRDLGQHFKLFTEVHEIRGAEDLARRLNAAKKRIGGNL